MFNSLTQGIKFVINLNMGQKIIVVSKFIVYYFCLGILPVYWVCFKVYCL